MTSHGIFQVVAITLVPAAIVKPLGTCMPDLFARERTVRHRAQRPPERLHDVTAGGAISGTLISFAVLSLRPVVEHFSMAQGRPF